MIVIANAYNVHGTYYSKPFILRWDAGSKGYEVDTSLSGALADQKGSGTIAGVRALLAKHS